MPRRPRHAQASRTASQPQAGGGREGMAQADDRTEILQAFGATPAIAAEILAYEADGYESLTFPSDLCFPLDDEAFVPIWQSYCVEAAARGFTTALADRLVQLQFPIHPGIS